MVLGIGCGCGGGRKAEAPMPSPAEVAAFDRFRQPERVLAALALSPGQIVADVGAGRGYFTHRIARAIGPGGRVVATDIDAAALAAIGPASDEEAAIEPRLVAPDDPGLERKSYDRILLAEVDHLLADRAGYLARLARALAPGGKIAVSNRRIYRAPLIAAAARAGLSVASERTDLPDHFFVLLEARQ
jgi:predicted methyltransferase